MPVLRALAAGGIALAVLASPSWAAVQRLPRTVVPVSQSVSLQLDPARSTYSGGTRISIRVQETTQVIEFHAEEMQIISCTLRLERIGFPLETEGRPDGHVRATSRRPITPGLYELDIQFQNDYGTQGVGLYRMTEGARSYLFTQFEEVDAREAFPCWDEPSFKIPFEFTIAAPESETVVFNTPVRSETVTSGWRTIVFEPTRPLPTYLLAIAVGRLDRVPIPGMSVPGSIYLLPDQREGAELALSMTPPLLAALERYFGEPYPFAKCDFIAVPELWAGAMEHPGAITFNARLYLLDSETASLDQKRYLAWTIAHELAHIWFGDLVTMEWWDDLWLNESFADWLSARVADGVYPELRLPTEELSYNARVLASDARPSSQAIRAPVEDMDEMLQNLDVQYDKGRAVLGMFEQWLGREPFRQGVLRYLARHRWKNATADDLWSALGSVADRDVPGAMRTFLEQPGVPLLHTEVLAGGRVRLVQRRYTALGVEQKPLLWQMPVVLRYADDSGVRQHSVFLDQASAVFLLPLQGQLRWLYPNADASGYYRWSLDDAMLANLLAAAPREFSERERVALASNLWSLVEAGLLPGERFLEVLAQLLQDEDPFVVRSALEELPRARDPFLTDETADSFARYVRRSLDASYRRWGGETTDELSPDAISLRPDLFTWLGDTGMDATVRRRMSNLADQYMGNPESVLYDEAGVALRVSAFDGDAKRFERYRRAFEEAESPGDRVQFLRALGSFRRPALRDSALAYSLSGPLRSTETFEIPRMVFRDRDSRDRLLDWALAHYDVLAERVPASVLTRIAGFAGNCSADRLARAERFLREAGREQGGMGTALDKEADEVAACRRLHERDGERVARYLTAQEDRK